MRINFILAIFLCVSNVLAQDTLEVSYSYLESNEPVKRVFLMDANLSLNFPSGRFSQYQINKPFLGFTINGMVQLQKEKPAFIGLEISHARLSSFSKSYDVINGNDAASVVGTLCSNTLSFDMIYRFYPAIGLKFVEPYFEGHFGGKWLYAYITESGYYYDSEIEYSENDFLSGDLVLNYGASMGLQAFLFDRYYLNIKASYLFSLSGKYYNLLTDDVAINADFPEEAYELVRSTTDNIRLDFGVTMMF